MSYPTNFTRRLSIMTAYDDLDRIRSVAHSNSTVGIIGYYNYAYNDANQRTSITNKDGRWAYSYDALGQVTAGKRYWPDGSIVAGQQFEYAYDDIGNRKSAGSGGNEWGSNLRYENYTVNNLNQYTERTVPGSVDVIGAATNAATVTVNDHPTYRKGEYFRADLPLSNSVSPVYASITNLAVLPNGTNSDITTNITGNLFLPKTPEVFLHDSDGNLVQDGQWTNRWDAENRWIEAETIATVPTAAKKKLVFGYDAKWRRIRKTVYDWNTNTSAWVVSKDLKFIYDGWNLLAELNGTNDAVINGYLWGLDISGTPQGAGGVGGLSAIKSAEGGTHFVGMDGNGNVTTLVNATNSTVSGTYEYEPFSKAIRVTGMAAHHNPFRFSTKQHDVDTHSIYYGYRYQLAHLGRWLNRDPLGESGDMRIKGRGYVELLPEGPNIYCFVHNMPSSLIDADGQAIPPLVLAAVGLIAVVEACALPQSAAAHNRYSDSSDKFKHCWVSCRISKTCGGHIAELAGLGKEIRDRAVGVYCEFFPDSKICQGGHGNFLDSIQDLIANQQCVGWEALVGGPLGGWIGAICRKSCEECCKEEVGYYGDE